MCLDLVVELIVIKKMTPMTSQNLELDEETALTI